MYYVVCGVAKSWTWLSDFYIHSISHFELVYYYTDPWNASNRMDSEIDLEVEPTDIQHRIHKKEDESEIWQLC